MTTRAEMRTLADASVQTVTALREIGEHYLADRIERCAAGRRYRVAGHRPWTCRGPGCPWCVRRHIAGWQRTVSDRIGDDPDVSTVVINLGAEDGGGDLRMAVRAFRRAVRDIRDRAGQRRRAWRALSVGGMLVPVAAGRIVVLRVHHADLIRPDVTALFRRRWPAATISASLSMCHISTVHMLPADRITLALLRRGIEPLRIALAPQGGRASRLRSQTCTYIEPMPVVVSVISTPSSGIR